jgi:hypothetical protein
MQYYGDGGPGPHTKLLRVDAPNGADERAWQRAPAFRWTPEAGWFPEPHAQLAIRQLGEFFLVDESDVPGIQAHMRAPYAAIQ